MHMVLIVLVLVFVEESTFIAVRSSDQSIDDMC